MGGWPGKYVIGLTGNIATGKSVVRKMLEHLGAFGIDADALAHQVIKKGAPGYQPVVETFGKWVLSPDGEIDRSRLGRLVFADREALKLLEGIIHPHVGLGVNFLVSRTSRKVAVIEAIKLLESGLSSLCDSLWTVYSSRQSQIERLVEKRGMSAAEAAQRVDAQPPQEAKVAAANVVIYNEEGFDETWKQVSRAWWEAFPDESKSQVEARSSTGALFVQRARPEQAEQIAQLFERLSGGQRQYTPHQVMVNFGEKAYLVLRQNGDLLGIAGWQVENLVVRIDEVHVDEDLPLGQALALLLQAAEAASQELQCEIVLLFLPLNYQQHDELFRSLGYSAQPVQSLGVRAWEEAARESSSTETYVMFKQLRSDRVLKPL